MNRDINDSEFKAHVDKVKNGKAHGVDGTLNEAIKAYKNLILPLLTKLFNMIFNEGLFPTAWGIGIIVSIFKSGPKTNPGNYRGISLLSNLSKIFTSIINQRIMLWSEQERIIGQCQAGFRQGKSTIDQMFVLKILNDKHLFRKRGRFYCLFVDFSKAFDTVNCDFLIYSLIKSGMHGKMLKLIQKVYSKVLLLYVPKKD